VSFVVEDFLQQPRPQRSRRKTQDGIHTQTHASNNTGSFLVSTVGVGVGQVSREFHRTLGVSLAEAVSLQVDLLDRDLRIAYARDGEVSISATAQSAFSIDPESLSTRLVIAQSGNRVEVREQPSADSPNLKLAYAIDVSYRTEVHASVGRGKQTITGIMGPVNAEVGDGDVDLSHVSLGVSARARRAI